MDSQKLSHKEVNNYLSVYFFPEFLDFPGLGKKKKKKNATALVIRIVNLYNKLTALISTVVEKKDSRKRETISSYVGLPIDSLVTEHLRKTSMCIHISQSKTEVDITCSQE